MSDNLILLREITFRVECADSIRDEIQKELITYIDDMSAETISTVGKMLQLSEPKLIVTVFSDES